MIAAAKSVVVDTADSSASAQDGSCGRQAGLGVWFVGSHFVRQTRTPKGS